MPNKKILQILWCGINKKWLMADENYVPQDHYRKQAASLSCYDAQELDSGVTGKEILSGSRDLTSLPKKDDVGVAAN
jgi:hypothetical protein